MISMHQKSSQKNLLPHTQEWTRQMTGDPDFIRFLQKLCICVCHEDFDFSMYVLNLLYYLLSLSLFPLCVNIYRLFTEVVELEEEKPHRRGSQLRRDYDITRLLYLWVREIDYRTNPLSRVSLTPARWLLKPFWIIYIFFGSTAS